MKRSYKGYDIEVTKEKSMGRDVLLYYSIFRQSDGLECCSGFTYGDESVSEFIKHMKDRVDGELKTKAPWGIE